MLELNELLPGAARELSSTLWNWDYVQSRCGNLMYAKFKKFEQVTPPRLHLLSNTHLIRSRGLSGAFGAQVNGVWEANGWMSMTLRDYGKYLEARREALAAGRTPPPSSRKKRAAPSTGGTTSPQKFKLNDAVLGNWKSQGQW